MRAFIRFLAGCPYSWVELTGAAWKSNRQVTLQFAVRKGRGGILTGRWVVRASGVREFSLSDVAGGGQVAAGAHPVLRQYTDAVAALRLGSPIEDVPAVIGELWSAHVALVDDWIPPEKFLGSPTQLAVRLSSGQGSVCRGPAFLVRHYEAILRRRGHAVALQRVRARPVGRVRLLHLGNSFLVASTLVSGRSG